MNRSCYLPGFWSGSAAFPGGPYDFTVPNCVLVIERATIINLSGSPTGVCALEVSDGTGLIPVCSFAPGVNDPLTVTFELNIGVAGGGQVNFAVASGSFGVAIAAYLSPLDATL